MSEKRQRGKAPSALAGKGGYAAWLRSIKAQIRSAQVKAAVRVNVELLHLYWDLGRDIAVKQLDAGYGSGFFERLSRDLKDEFPNMEGFSVSNLYNIKKFYLFYAAKILQQPAGNLGQVSVERGVREILQQPAGKLANGNLHQAGANSDNRHQVGDDSDGGGEILHQAGGELEIVNRQQVADGSEMTNRQQVADEFGEAFFSIPWWHHVVIFTHAGSVEEALFYVAKTAENGWSRNVLTNMMDADLYHAEGRAVTNFAAKLPEPESDLAQQTLKDPYCFDFLALRERYTERELEDALVENIARFLLELGSGFAFVGRQYRLEVGGDEFFVDLLFYHLGLRRYVVVELKTGPFKPEFAGQLGFYVQAVNEQLKRPDDGDTIGLLICERKNRLVAEYSLKSSAQLLGVSEYRLTKLLPKDFKSSLPSVRDIEAELADRTKKEARK